MEHFSTKNYTLRLDIVQNFSCLIFWNKMFENIHHKIFETISGIYPINFDVCYAAEKTLTIEF